MTFAPSAPETLVAWFHHEFGTSRCIHPINEDAQCEKWAAQFVQSGPPVELVTESVDFEPILTYLAETMRADGATEGQIGNRQAEWIFKPMGSYEAHAYARGFRAGCKDPERGPVTDLNRYKRDRP